jgi:predicted short-subunit dehydrogenase-like oxidoreductase (DUF2520 family)
MLPNRKSRRPSISLIGSGNLSQALGPALRAAGYRIEIVAFRDTTSSRRRAVALARKIGARAVPIHAAKPDSSITWLCHTDDALPATARLLARKSGWKGKIVFHSSGALTSDVLRPLQRAGAYVASVHPMMTFVPGTRTRMERISFGVEGDLQAVRAATRIAAKLRAEAVRIRKDSKVLYHALGSFSSPLLVATLATAERVALAAGLTRGQARKMIGPLVEQTIKNYLRKGAAPAFSGPIQRGDVDTIRRHLGELRKLSGVTEVYRALVKSALRDLPTKNAKALKALLEPGH